MHKKHITEFANVSEIILAYHKDPSGIIEYVENYTKHLDKDSDGVGSSDTVGVDTHETK